MYITRIKPAAPHTKHFLPHTGDGLPVLFIGAKIVTILELSAHLEPKKQIYALYFEPILCLGRIFVHIMAGSLGGRERGSYIMSRICVGIEKKMQPILAKPKYYS